MKRATVISIFLAIFCTLIYFTPVHVNAGDFSIPNISINIGDSDTPGQAASGIQMMLVLTVISLAPYILVMLTSFTRIIIVLHFTRSALGTQQMPPNQVLVGLALFMTLFLMAPTFGKINDNAIKPLSRGEITQEQAIERGLEPLREFMVKQVETKDVELFAKLSGQTGLTKESMPYSVLIPAFLLGEISKGFRFGFIIYMPFIVVDMVVASTLMAMGMMMLPPAMISLPFKILLFVLLDGWNLTLEMLTKTFR